MQVVNLDNIFSGISPLERSLQHGCMDIQHFIPRDEANDKDRANGLRFGVHHQLQIGATIASASKAHGSGTFTKSVHGLNEGVG
jgi:hypothetical protein